MYNRMTVTFLDGEAVEISAVGYFLDQGVEIKENIFLTCSQPLALPPMESPSIEYLVMLKHTKKGKYPYGLGSTWKMAFDSFLVHVMQSIISHADSIHIDQDVEEMAYLNKCFALIEDKT